jgi:hypothetical protein
VILTSFDQLPALVFYTMKLSTSLAIELLVGAYYLVGRAQGACNKDKWVISIPSNFFKLLILRILMKLSCLRALFPTANPTLLASAQSFCQIYTQGVSTAMTGFIPQVTAACGSSPSRYSSACSCGSAATVTTTSTTTLITTTSTTSTTTTSTAPTCAPTPYEQFQNGDFECGSLYPWRALVTEGTTYALTSPGFTGSFAFEVDQNAPLDGVGIGEAILAQLFYITPGTQYVLTFDTFFNVGNGGFIGVKFNGAPQYTVDASDKLGPGVWNSNTISFTATTGQYLLEFEFLFGTSSVVAKIDNVVLSPPT